jgi:predicted exporter
MGIVFILLWLLNLLVVKLIRNMALHTRLEKVQPSPTMDGTILVMIDGFCAWCNK